MKGSGFGMQGLEVLTLPCTPLVLSYTNLLSYLVENQSKGGQLAFYLVHVHIRVA
jgi:hypothetical protein